MQTIGVSAKNKIYSHFIQVLNERGGLGFRLDGGFSVVSGLECQLDGSFLVCFPSHLIVMSWEKKYDSMTPTLFHDLLLRMLGHHFYINSYAKN